MLTFHFGSYSGLLASLADSLNRRQTEELRKFNGWKASSPLDIVVSFFLELARLDLNPKYRLLRKQAGKVSWNWDAAKEAALSMSYVNLLKPLRKRLDFDKDICAVDFTDIRPDDVMQSLWSIYQQPLRLALINALGVAPSLENLLEAIEKQIRPKFALILKSK